jgi:hypothetical protein
MKITAKITRVKRRGGFDSLRLSIVRYFRDGHGRPTSEILVPFPTVRSTYADNADVQRAFWKRADSEINRLRETDRYMNADLDSIESRFAEVIPRPTIATPEPAASIDYEGIQRRFPYLKRIRIA